jgi:adenosylmethionine-8-amino-7-oxononanoate aminotransferase
VVYFMPPYVINEEEIELMVNVAWEAIQYALKD